ncbi:hypothetical protein jhhlp_000134 [Lomentospora prolificans]|uniref:Utp8 beta-propeller domain-containing protein n=1 Tax=Lomentospora prolificans TaxID=41688 RepID=A0A2N3NLP4_9PEZI|nr:hypothetical protein jhhlp_000134 [Lomentospora prolificans]
MSANYKIQKPYVLAELPRPLGQAKRSYVIGEVYGHHPSHGKRKRPELVVGINGEAANLYDVSASRLITSYPIPPQQSFTCSPISLRIRLSKGQGVARYTYIATKESTGQAMTLFRDIVDGAGKTTSTSKTRHFKTPSPIRYIGVSPSITSSKDSNDSHRLVGNLLIICTNGDVISLDPETLEQKWKESASKLSRDEMSSPISEYTVELVAMTSAIDVIEGVFEGRPDAFMAAFPQKASIDETNPDTLVLVSHLMRNGVRERQLSVIGIIPSDGPAASMQRMLQLHVTPIPSQSTTDPETTSDYKLHLQSGSLLELRNSNLVVYNITTAISTVRHTLNMQGATSFLRLSGHSILAGSQTHLTIYNPTFHSLQATAPLDISAITPKPMAEGLKSTYTLSTYFRRLDIAVGLYDNLLVAVQVEPPASGGKRSYADGLLIDSIGRGAPKDVPAPAARPNKKMRSSALSTLLPGSIAGTYMAAYLQEMDKADELLAAENLNDFEQLLANKFQITVAMDEDEEKGPDGQSLPHWMWLSNPSQYPLVDRRWVLYAIGRVLSLDANSENANSAVKLALASSNVFIYLVIAGHLTLSNIRAAFRGVDQGPELSDAIIAEGLALRLAEVDPTLELLVNYILATKLGPVELLMGIRAIMRSLDYVRDSLKSAPKLLTQEAHESEEDEELRMELDQLDQQIQATEYHLGDQNSTRSNGLTAAFAKLGTHSGSSVVKALRTCLKADEIFSLIFVLRAELVRGSWTSRYVDVGYAAGQQPEAPPDDSICLIASLLSRCVDAVGPTGWLLNNSLSSNAESETGDFLRALKLEVSAALEGVEEAVQLNGLLSEVVRYGTSVREQGLPPIAGGASGHLKLQRAEANMLPLGLKARQSVSKEKVVSGGEVVKRSQREIGHLISQKVQAYSLERITL